MSLLNKQLFYNPVCICCGSFFVSETLFCSECYEQFMQPRISLLEHEVNKKDKGYSLIEWQPGESDLLSEFVYRFKYDKCKPAWNYYVNKMIDDLNDKITFDEVDFIVPIPGSSKKSVHSLIMAQIISKKTEIPVIDILYKEVKDYSESVQQKHKDKHERQQIQIHLNEQFTCHSNNSKFDKSHMLLVDDILTTGNSFKQSKAALGRVKKATLLTLFYRSNY